MVEASPKIAIESSTLSVPIFPSNALLLSLAARPGFSNSPRGEFMSNGQAQKPQSRRECTDCPNVIVCDDDPFQTMYYKMLFEGLFGAAEKDATNKFDMRLELFPCGEGLYARYLKVRACGCGSLILAITDYNMGKGKMNGVETIRAMRKSGYAGPLVLRSSEERKYLLKQHPDFDSLLRSGFITQFVDKNNAKKAKEVIQEILKAQTS